MLKFEDVHEGDTLIADNGFDCLEEGQECQVERRDGDLVVPCANGCHRLSGQLDRSPDGELIIIGFTKKEAQL